MRGYIGRVARQRAPRCCAFLNLSRYSPLSRFPFRSFWHSKFEKCHSPEYFSVCICSEDTAKFAVAFGGQPFRFCWVRRVWVACRDGPRGGTSGGAGSGGESLPVSVKISAEICRPLATPPRAFNFYSCTCVSKVIAHASISYFFKCIVISKLCIALVFETVDRSNLVPPRGN